MSGTLNLPQGQIDTLLERFPAILTEAERALPEPQRNAKALARISHMIKTNEKNKANLAQQNGQVRPPNGGGGGPSQVRPPPQNGNTNAQAGGSGTMQSGQQGQINQGQHAGQVGQSPKMVMYNGGMVMPQAGQQMNASQQQVSFSLSFGFVFDFINHILCLATSFRIGFCAFDASPIDVPFAVSSPIALRCLLPPSPFFFFVEVADH